MCFTKEEHQEDTTYKRNLLAITSRKEGCVLGAGCRVYKQNCLLKGITLCNNSKMNWVPPTCDDLKSLFQLYVDAQQKQNEHISFFYFFHCTHLCLSLEFFKILFIFLNSCISNCVDTNFIDIWNYCIKLLGTKFQDSFLFLFLGFVYSCVRSTLEGKQGRWSVADVLLLWYIHQFLCIIISFQHTYNLVLYLPLIIGNQARYLSIKCLNMNRT